VEQTEAAIIGAGPAGLLAAREIARRGIDVKIFEEHLTVGEPDHCAGLVSVEGLQRLQVEPSRRFIRHEIRGGRIYAPNGTFLEFRSEGTRAFVLDRPAFDRHLAEMAEKERAVVRTGRRVDGLEVVDGRITGIRVGDELIKADVVIDAEGAADHLLKQSIRLSPRKAGRLIGLNAEVSDVDVEPGMVEVWMGRDLAPGLFAWVIPLGEDTARCGLACNDGFASDHLKRFIETRFGSDNYTGLRGGVVLTDGPSPRTYFDGLLVVGDAAGQTKPTTGGGVILGGLCAIQAGIASAEAVNAGDFSSGRLRSYERSWRDLLGKEFRSMLGARRMLNRLSDNQINEIFRAIKGEGLEELLRGLLDEGDMDFQGGVLSRGLKNPNLLRVLIKVAGQLALGELKAVFNV